MHLELIFAWTQLKMGWDLRRSGSSVVSERSASYHAFRKPPLPGRQGDIRSHPEHGS